VVGELSEEPLEDIPPELVELYGLQRLPFDQLRVRVSDLLDLSGKRAIVVGGGGEGLGQAISHRLGAQGAATAVLDLDGARAEAVAAEVAERWGATTFGLAADTADWASIEGAVGRSVELLGGVDVLVNSAGGVLGFYGRFVERRAVEIERTVQLNLVGAMLATRATLPYMIEAGSGRIVNVASESGKIGQPDLAVYAAAKAGTISFTKSLAHEVSGLGVTVAAVCPGPMLNPRTYQWLRTPDADPHGPGPHTAVRRVMDDAMQRVTVGRASLPEEVANMIVFLASDAGSYVHGAALSVGGGMSD
jgi:3-oxoacyl-[acyl-carrier protein] reductase